MLLKQPIILTPPTITRANGEVRVQKPVTISELHIVIIDDNNRQSVFAQIRPCPYPLILWEKEAYVAIGDYTQAAAESRVLELLGSDVKAGLEALFVRPATLTPPAA